MGREIVSNLKFKKVTGIFDPSEFAKMLDNAYLATKRGDQTMTKTSFSPSTIGYGHGKCPRYWYLAFSGVGFIDENDSIAVANMAQGTQATLKALAGYGAESRATMGEATIEGKSNNTGEFSTATSTTTTTLNNERIGFNSVILFMPLDLNSAAELKDIYFDTFTQGSCTVHHGSHGVSRNYRYIIVG